MKKLVVLTLSVTVLGFLSCRSRINDMHHPVNSTASGDYSTYTDGYDQNDTLWPVKPDALDTSGEQTGRMNRTLGTIAMEPLANSGKGNTSAPRPNAGAEKSSK